MSSNPSDVLVIGGGPAGLSAVVTLVRQLHTVTVFDSQSYRNSRSPYMHMVLTWDHEDPADFRAAARENILKRYEGVTFQDVEIISVVKIENGLFEATANNGQTWSGRKLVLASGVNDIFPAIEGYADCWVKGIFHCLFCKGYEERDALSSGILAIDSLASEAHALHVARMALQLTPRCVTIYTNGSEELASTLAVSIQSAPQMKVNAQRIKKLVMGSKKAEVVIQFEDGTEKTEGFLGHSPKTQLKSAFAEQLGLQLTPAGDIMTSPPFLQTSVPGVFAAGDCSSPMKMAGNAQYAGNLAGAGASAQLQADALGQKPLF